jgi:hypothetical protein
MEHKDRLGRILQVGVSVRLCEAPASLLNGLPLEDQRAIRDQVGKVMVLVDFDRLGLAELEFDDATGVLHTIWIESTALEIC